MWPSYKLVNIDSLSEKYKQDEESLSPYSMSALWLVVATGLWNYIVEIFFAFKAI